MGSESAARPHLAGRPMPMRSKSRAVLQQYAGPKEERKRGTSFAGAFIAPRVSRAYTTSSVRV